jgi:hypothetical protein
VIVPDTVVIDHGKVFLSEVFLRAADTLGIYCKQSVHTAMPSRPSMNAWPRRGQTNSGGVNAGAYPNSRTRASGDFNDIVRSPLCARTRGHCGLVTGCLLAAAAGLDLDAGAHRRCERNGNGHANANPEARRDITVPRWRGGWRWRWWWWWWWERCRHAGVGWRVEHGPPPAFGCVTHPRRNQCHECERRQRGRADDCQTVNYARHRTPPSDLPRRRSDEDFTPGRPPVLHN